MRFLGSFLLLFLVNSLFFVFSDASASDGIVEADPRYSVATVFSPELTFSDAKVCLEALQAGLESKDSVKLLTSDMKLWADRAESYWVAVIEKASSSTQDSDLLIDGRFVASPNAFDYSKFRKDMPASFLGERCGFIQGSAVRAVGITGETGLVFPDYMVKDIEARVESRMDTDFLSIVNCSAVSVLAIHGMLDEISDFFEEERYVASVSSQAWLRVLNDRLVSNDGAGLDVFKKSDVWAALSSDGLEKARFLSERDNLQEVCAQ